jgi:hypothetical protein
MERNLMQLDTERTRIMKDMYRPSSNLIKFFKSILTIVVQGDSPINKTPVIRKGVKY